MLAWSAVAQAGALQLQESQEPLQVGPALQVWKDPEGQARFEQVRALVDSVWQPVTRRDASFGYSGAAYWLRLQLHNPQPRSADWMLVSANPLLDYLDAYGLDEARAYRTGDQRPFAERWIEHRQFVMPLRLAEGETRTLYLRMQTAGSATLSASLMSAATFQHHEQRSLLLQGLFFGALTVMLVYNLLIFVITRDRDYLWYSLFVAGFGFYQLIQLGFAFQWLWPQALGWQQRSFPFSAAVATLFAILFTAGFLDLHNSHRRYRQAVRLLLGASMGVALLALLGPYTLALLSSFVLVGVCALLACLFTLLRVRAGYRPARLFALGWIALIIASLLHVLSGVGVLPYSLATLQAQQFGGLIELVMFAIALAARIRHTQRAHQQTLHQLYAQEHALRLEQAHGLDLQQEINEGLERRVLERTQALEQAMAELSAANRRLAELNRQDGLTGLLNRPAFNDELQRAWVRAERAQRPLALLMLDLDLFKRINDTHGHLAGDACLQHVARLLQAGLRGGDTLARFGGEEFVIILPDTDDQGARELAERLRADIAGEPCWYGEQAIPLSLSVGVAAGLSPLTREQLLHRADLALYAAKAAGRNTVESYEASALDGV
ncbi:MAG: diguanylate cyclase [Pseudomonadota bacterium]